MRFNVADPSPGTSLNEVLPLALRARVWLARATLSPTFPEHQSVQFVGALHMIEGFEYHQTQFTKHLQASAGYLGRVDAMFALLSQDAQPTNIAIPIATETEKSHLEALDHEAIAYLNRVGQFFYFAKSVGKIEAIPTISYLTSFRNKHTAHRSIDAPRKEDEAHQQMQAMAFGFHRLTLHGMPRYQIIDDGEHKQFCMAEDHPLVMREATDLLLSLHPAR